MRPAQLTWDFAGGQSTLLFLRLRYWLGKGFLGKESAGAVTPRALVNRES